MRLLFKVLAAEQYAKVKLPSPAEIDHYKEIILQNFPYLNGVWSMMDGLWISIQASGDKRTQNAYASITPALTLMASLICLSFNVVLEIEGFPVPGFSLASL